ncbi:MAG TPA: ATP-binding protein [Ktedonobacteraceae bacterium]|nr:ATP-binding protein [Ktedonobacteraceae bacterium]
MQTGKLNLQKEPFALDELVQETVENVQAATPTHLLLIEGKTDAQVFGDKDRVGQVFVNLLTNAIKYSPHANQVIVHLHRDQERAHVSIQDFGIGIDEVHHQQIFERFYQITDPDERTYPGLGIGLNISSEIVERHHGRIWVESKKGDGATFSVSLPLLIKEG